MKMVMKNLFGYSYISIKSRYQYVNKIRQIFNARNYSWGGNQNHGSPAKNYRHLIYLPGIILGTAIGYYCFGNKFSSNYKLNIIPEVSAALVGRRKEYNFIADVVDICAPSVVYIEIKDTRRFDYFSGQPFTASNGSGFIIKSDGLILTNAHVVINKPHTVVHVKLLDGRTFPGFVEDVDQASDLATVRINVKNLPVMKLGQSANLRAGEWVVALGSPLALSNTVTAGVVSSPQRASQELGLRGRDMHYIQTDAAITFGNSGGPLVNLDGEAIGINSMKVTAGISFAIPIDYAKLFIARSLERKDKGAPSRSILPMRRYMGITMLTLTDEILQELRQRTGAVSPEVKHGILVWKVIVGSPAHQGGLNPGDIITHINEKVVRNSTDIYDALAVKGSSLNVTVYRGLKQMRFTIKPEDLEN